jgi:hypothetical protein
MVQAAVIMMRIPTQRLTSTFGEKVHLAGCTVIQVRFTSVGAAASLLLSAADQSLSELSIEEVVTLTRDHDQVALCGAKVGAGYDPRSLAPLLDLLGEQVEHVNARPGGQLMLTFSHGWTLTVGVTDYDEPGWQLRSGRVVTLI